LGNSVLSGRAAGGRRDFDVAAPAKKWAASMTPTAPEEKIDCLVQA